VGQRGVFLKTEKDGAACSEIEMELARPKKEGRSHGAERGAHILHVVDGEKEKGK